MGDGALWSLGQGIAALPSPPAGTRVLLLGTYLWVLMSQAHPIGHTRLNPWGWRFSAGQRKQWSKALILPVGGKVYDGVLHQQEDCGSRGSCGTELKALLRSRKVMLRGSFISPRLVSDAINGGDLFHYSWQTWWRKPFWVDASVIPLDRQNFSGRLPRILCSSFPVVEVSAMGWKGDGSFGSFPLLTRISQPCVRIPGHLWESARIRVNRAARNGWHAGRCHR